MESQYAEKCSKFHSESQTFPYPSKSKELEISANLEAKISVTDTEKSISADLEANISAIAIEKNMIVPDGLLCPVCRELIKDAVICPENVCEMCDNCARKDLNSKCPVCFESISLDELIPNRKTRLAVEVFRNSLTISELSQGFEKGVLKYSNKHNSTENKNGTEQEIVQEEEIEMFEKDFEMDLPFYGYTSSPIKTQPQTPTTGYTVQKCSADFCGQIFSSDEKLKQHETEHIQSHPLEYKIVPFFVPKIGSPKSITGINLKQENVPADEDYELEKNFEMEFEKDFEMKFEEDFEMQPFEYKMVPFFVPKTGPPEPETGNNFRKKIEKASPHKLKGVWKKSRRQQQRRKRYVKALWSKK